jgi:hypothetical protein
MLSVELWSDGRPTYAIGQIQGKPRFKRQIRREFILMLDQRQALPNSLSLILNPVVIIVENGLSLIAHRFVLRSPDRKTRPNTTQDFSEDIQTRYTHFQV